MSRLAHSDDLRHYSAYPIIARSRSRLLPPWNGSFVPRSWFAIRTDQRKCASKLQIFRAAYRNRTDDLRITRATIPSCTHASCTDSTGNRTDGTGGAGIIRRPGPRTGPRRRPCVPAILLLCVNVADDIDPRPQADTAPGPTVDLYAATHTVRLADARICRCEDFQWPG
jgi:hypothetical protein